jgi:ABC-type glycerol-3-phosphate transport system substrate-binding protein
MSLLINMILAFALLASACFASAAPAKASAASDARAKKLLCSNRAPADDEVTLTVIPHGPRTAIFHEPVKIQVSEELKALTMAKVYEVGEADPHRPEPVSKARVVELAREAGAKLKICMRS